MLIEHRIDNMNKCFVACKQPVSSGKQVSFEPAFALMFAQYFHCPSLGCEKFVIILCLSFPLPVGQLKNGVQTIGKDFVGAENPEIILVLVKFYHIAKELTKHMCVRRHYRTRRCN